MDGKAWRWIECAHEHTGEGVGTGGGSFFLLQSISPGHGLQGRDATIDMTGLDSQILEAVGAQLVQMMP